MKRKKQKRKKPKSKPKLGIKTKNLPALLTTGKIAKILKVSVITVGQWIDKEWLIGSRLPSAGTRQGRRRVKKKDFIKFLKEQQIPLKRLRKEKVFTTRDIALAAEVSIKTITRWLEEDLIPFFRVVSKRRLTFEKDVIKFFKKSDFDLDILEKISEEKEFGLPKRLDR